MAFLLSKVAGLLGFGGPSTVEPPGAPEPLPSTREELIARVAAGPEPPIAPVSPAPPARPPRGGRTYAVPVRLPTPPPHGGSLALATAATAPLPPRQRHSGWSHTAGAGGTPGKAVDFTRLTGHAHVPRLLAPEAGDGDGGGGGGSNCVVEKQAHDLTVVERAAVTTVHASVHKLRRGASGAASEHVDVPASWAPSSAATAARPAAGMPAVRTLLTLPSPPLPPSRYDGAAASSSLPHATADMPTRSLTRSLVVPAAEHEGSGALPDPMSVEQLGRRTRLAIDSLASLEARGAGAADGYGATSPSGFGAGNHPRQPAAAIGGRHGAPTGSPASWKSPPAPSALAPWLSPPASKPAPPAAAADEIVVVSESDDDDDAAAAPASSGVGWASAAVARPAHAQPTSGFRRSAAPASDDGSDAIVLDGDEEDGEGTDEDEDEDAEYEDDGDDGGDESVVDLVTSSDSDDDVPMAAARGSRPISRIPDASHDAAIFATYDPLYRAGSPFELSPDQRRRVLAMLISRAEMLLTPAEQEYVVARISRDTVSLLKLQCVVDGQWLNDEVINFGLMKLLVDNAQLLTERAFAGAGSGVRGGSAAMDLVEDDDVGGGGDFVLDARGIDRPVRTFAWNEQFLQRLTFAVSEDDKVRYDYAGVRRWSKARGLNIHEVDLILVPINVSKVHWTLGVIDMAHRCLHYYDSLGSRAREGSHDWVALNKLRRWVGDEVAAYPGALGSHLDTSKWPIHAHGTAVPQQDNGSDCGVFMLQFARCIAHGHAFDFSQADIPTLRLRLIADMLHWQATNGGSGGSSSGGR